MNSANFFPKMLHNFSEKQSTPIIQGHPRDFNDIKNRDMHDFLLLAFKSPDCIVRNEPKILKIKHHFSPDFDTNFNFVCYLDLSSSQFFYDSYF